MKVYRQFYTALCDMDAYPTKEIPQEGVLCGKGLKCLSDLYKNIDIKKFLTIAMQGHQQVPTQAGTKLQTALPYHFFKCMPDNIAEVLPQ